MYIIDYFWLIKESDLILINYITNNATSVIYVEQVVYLDS